MCQKSLCTTHPFKVPPKIWPKTYVTATHQAPPAVDDLFAPNPASATNPNIPLKAKPVGLFGDDDLFEDAGLGKNKEDIVEGKQRNASQ